MQQKGGADHKSGRKSERGETAYKVFHNSYRKDNMIWQMTPNFPLSTKNWDDNKDVTWSMENIRVDILLMLR